MIYKSKEKVQDIIDNYDGLRTPMVTGGSFAGYLKFEIPVKNRLQIAISILKKQEKYHEKFNDNFSIGHYYVINGNMSYIGFEAGNHRKLEERSFVEKLSGDKFFVDDWLMFQILLDVESEDWKQINVKCMVENLACFTGYNICDKIIFAKNTLDPGILEKEIPITGVVRIDNIDREQRVCYGNPLYLKTNYD